MNNVDHYNLVESYTMKCRLYPNKECAKKIDKAIYAVQSFHNCLLYDIFNGNIDSTPKPYKPKKEIIPEQKDGESDLDYQKKVYAYEQKQRYKAGDIIHFPDLKKAFSAKYKNQLIKEHPIISEAPQAAITTNVGLVSDIKKSLGKLPIEFQKPNYYSKKKRRRSYIYQESCNKVFTKDNYNALYINLSKVGICKIKGWNKNIRFDKNGTKTFIDYCSENPKNKFTVIVKKDKCDDYWICFVLSNVYLPEKEQTNKIIGIDVGVSDLVILSNGIKYLNKHFKKDEEKHLAFLERKQSKQQGWKNQNFQIERKKNPELLVSKGYEKTGLKIKKLNRKISEKRKNYNNNVTRNIIDNNYFIGIESLNVSGLMKDFKDDKTNAQNATTHKNLSDATMGEILRMLRYKSEWHDKRVVAVNRYFPSSKICSHCGYQKSEMPVNIRIWECPKCGSVNDRDINAAQNILKQALIDTYGYELGNEYYKLGFIK